jgi:peptidoglycan biosynthesis protein MviN/MurJ (putative lipid II flippase)
MSIVVAMLVIIGSLLVGSAGVMIRGSIRAFRGHEQRIAGLFLFCGVLAAVLAIVFFSSIMHVVNLPWILAGFWFAGGCIVMATIVSSIRL